MQSVMKLALAGALFTGASLALAQDEKPEGGDHPRPPHEPPPLIAALDANKDRVIDADEIANAAEALKALDKNGDGKLTVEEFAPPRPPGGKKGDRPPRGERPPKKE